MALLTASRTLKLPATLIIKPNVAIINPIVTSIFLFIFPPYKTIYTFSKDIFKCSPINGCGTRWLPKPPLREKRKNE
jgi:hypothetical protein